jgi:poly-gamma-glutamate capsule biosynthesis protein CapA/YwtB (metallophosphatase superfamily)
MKTRVLIGIALLAALGAAVALWLVSDSSETGEPSEPSRPEAESNPEPSPAQAPPRRPEPERRTVAASGDMLIHSPVYERALALGGGSEYDFAPMLAPLEPWIKRADLAFCHLETSLSGDRPPSGYPLFNSPPSLALAIESTGWDACSIASNHAVDQGQEGIDATLETLDRADLGHAGTYSSEPASRRPLVTRAGKVKVALLSYTTDLNGLEPPAPWSVNLVEGPGPVLRDARRAVARGADAVIVNVHWGSGIVPEYTHTPSPAQRDFATRLAQSPAITAVVGQGPHVVQPIERIDGKYVVFSEGNLISNQGADSGLPTASQDGLVAYLDLIVRRSGARVRRVRYLPVWVRHPDYAVLPATGGTAPDARARVVDVVGRGGGIAPLERSALRSR